MSLGLIQMNRRAGFERVDAFGARPTGTGLLPDAGDHDEAHNAKASPTSTSSSSSKKEAAKPARKRVKVEKEASDDDDDELEKPKSKKADASSSSSSADPFDSDFEAPSSKVKAEPDSAATPARKAPPAPMPTSAGPIRRAKVGNSHDVYNCTACALC